jgi:hypothetical protein
MTFNISKAFGCSLHLPTCVGKVWNSSQKREDEQILKDIRAKDCSCVEVRPHARVVIMTMLGLEESLCWLPFSSYKHMVMFQIVLDSVQVI